MYCHTLGIAGNVKYVVIYVNFLEVQISVQTIIFIIDLIENWPIIENENPGWNLGV